MLVKPSRYPALGDASELKPALPFSEAAGQQNQPAGTALRRRWHAFHHRGPSGDVNAEGLEGENRNATQADGGHDGERGDEAREYCDEGRSAAREVFAAAVTARYLSSGPIQATGHWGSNSLVLLPAQIFPELRVEGSGG